MKDINTRRFQHRVNEQHIQFFCENYNLKRLINQPTCYKNPNSPLWIDLILTNIPCSFQRTCVIETVLSDFHLITSTVVRNSFEKIRPRIINYRCFKQISNEAFRETLPNNLSGEEFLHNNITVATVL